MLYVSCHFAKRRLHIGEEKLESDPLQTQVSSMRWHASFCVIHFLYSFHFVLSPFGPVFSRFCAQGFREIVMRHLPPIIFLTIALAACGGDEGEGSGAPEKVIGGL